MNKPNLDNPPEWANYLAQDQDGKWAWFENEPTPQLGVSGYWINKSGKWMSVIDKPNPDWVNTLEKLL